MHALYFEPLVTYSRTSFEDIVTKHKIFNSDQNLTKKGNLFHLPPLPPGKPLNFDLSSLGSS